MALFRTALSRPLPRLTQIVRLSFSDGEGDILKHFTKRCAFLVLAAALLSPLAPETARASETHLVSSLVQTVQYYRYGPGYGPRFYGRRFYRPRFHRYYGPGYYRRGYYGHRFYR